MPFLPEKLDISLAVPYYLSPVVRTPVTTKIAFCPAFLLFSPPLLSVSNPICISFISIPDSQLPLNLTFEASPPILPHLSLALNQMEHIKSGMRSRQWLL